MKTPEHGIYREPHSGEVWLEELRRDNPDMVFIDGVADIAEIADRQLDVHYGSGSDHPLAYHNKQHSSDVVERALKLLRIHQGVTPNSFIMQRAPSLIASAGKLHDIVQLRGPVTNEQLSAEYARDIAPNYGFAYAEADLQADMIMGTVTQKVDGKLQQTRLEQTQSRDPLCLILATADINGIAMEGLHRMIKDSVNLTAEKYEIDSTKVLLEKPHEVAKMFGAQTAFFGNRLDQIERDLRLFYSEDTAREIQAEYQREFGSLGGEAIRAANLLSRTPDLLGDVISIDVTQTVDLAVGSIVAQIRKLLPKSH